MTLKVLIEGFLEALRLIVTGDAAVFDVTLRSICVSTSATLLASSWSIPLALVVGLGTFPGKSLVKGSFNAFLGVPTVALGLFFFLLFSRSGPLGMFHLLYTMTGMIIGQSMLITPIIVSYATNAIESVDVDLRDLARALGASETRVALTIVRESISGVALAIVGAFNRAFAELGVVMMVGGNIRNVTRVLTTAIALETARGEMAFSIALAVILVMIVYPTSLILNFLRMNR